MASSREKKKAKKHEEEAKDRLSDLPDNLLLHILSFLPETKQAVRASVLPKRWKCLWASLSVLIFHGYGKTLKKLVRRVLSGHDNSPITKFCFHFDGTDKSLVTRIINYSVSHNVQHFSISLWSASITILFPLFNRCRSLKTLELIKFEELLLLRGFSLPTLTTLRISSCSFCSYSYYESSRYIDPFVSLANLKSLKLEGFYMGSRVRNFKISGPQLHSLTISHARHYSLEGCKFEIIAPKLNSFNFIKSYPVEFSNLDFPLLEIADIDAHLPYNEERFSKSNLDLINMLRGLYHAQSLNLSSNTIKVLMECPGVLEAQASPFVRLKTLNIRSYSNSFTITDKVMNYFLSGSTFGKDIRIKIQENQRH